MRFFNKRGKKLYLIIMFIMLLNFMVPTYSHADLSTTLVNPIKGFVLLLSDGVMSLLQGLVIGDTSVTNQNVHGLSGDVKYTPDKIFSNKIALFNINFFNISKDEALIENIEKPSVFIYDKRVETNLSLEKWQQAVDSVVQLEAFYNWVTAINLGIRNSSFDFEEYVRENYPYSEINNHYKNVKEAIVEYQRMTGITDLNWDGSDAWNMTWDFWAQLVKKHVPKTKIKQYILCFNKLDGWFVNEDKYIELCISDLAKDTASKQQHMAESLEFFRGEFSGYTSSYQESSIYAPAYILKKTISKYYYILRNLAMVGSLFVLIYCGIKIIISSASKDKAKYKAICLDWLVGLCILFFMHYIMVFMVNGVEKLTQIISQYFSSTDVGNYINIIRTNSEISDNLQQGLGYTVMYIAVIVLLIVYTFTYLRRVLYMAFLTIIAPFVAFTYPLDKLKDGQAQAFNMWIKEYIFNLLIQPMHLILYTTIMGSAIDLANANMIYAIVALAFITQAEKIVRKFFGFEKAQTPGFLNGPAGGALMMEGFKKLTGWGPGPRRSNKNDKNLSASRSENDEDLGSVNISSGNPYQAMLGLNSFNSGSNSENVSSGETASRVNYDHSDKENGNTENEYQEIIKESGWNRDEAREQLIENGWDEAEANQLLTDVYGAGNTTHLSATSNNEGMITSAGGRSTQQPLAQQQINSQSSSQSSNNSSNVPRRSKWRAVKRLGRTVLKNHPPMKTVGQLAGKTARFTLKSAGAVAGGLLGLGMGIATGDPKHAFSYTITGTKGGQHLAGGLAEVVTDGKNGIMNFGRNAKGILEEGYYTQDEYEKILARRQFEKMRKNQDLRNKLELNVPGIRLKEVFRDGGDLEQYSNAGMGVDQIIAGLKFRNSHTQFSQNDVIAAMKISKEIQGKDIDKQKKILYESFKYQNPSLSDDQLNRLVNEQIGYHKELEKYQKNIR